MARPKIKEDKKRASISITVRQDTMQLAKEAGNSSRFFEQAADSMMAIGSLMSDLTCGRAKRAEVLEDIEDIIDSWYRLRDESLSIDAIDEASVQQKKAATA
jgi:hypothetical protein